MITTSELIEKHWPEECEFFVNTPGECYFQREPDNPESPEKPFWDESLWSDTDKELAAHVAHSFFTIKAEAVPQYAREDEMVNNAIQAWIESSRAWAEWGGLI